MNKNLTLLVSRILLAHMFLIAGLGKIGAYAGTQAYMQSMGVPGALLPLVILLEIGGSLALITGFFTRWMAVALGIFTAVAALIFHHDFANQMQQIMFMKNWTIVGGMLLLTVTGAGAWSIDAKMGRA
jgi:putative oxidoreductase